MGSSIQINKQPPKALQLLYNDTVVGLYGAQDSFDSDNSSRATPVTGDGVEATMDATFMRDASDPYDGCSFTLGIDLTQFASDSPEEDYFEIHCIQQPAMNKAGDFWQDGAVSGAPGRTNNNQIQLYDAVTGGSNVAIKTARNAAPPFYYKGDSIETFGDFVIKVRNALDPNKPTLMTVETTLPFTTAGAPFQDFAVNPQFYTTKYYSGQSYLLLRPYGNTNGITGFVPSNGAGLDWLFGAMHPAYTPLVFIDKFWHIQHLDLKIFRG